MLQMGFGKTSPLRSDQAIVQIMNNDALDKDGRPCTRVKYAWTLSVSVYKTLPQICGRNKLKKTESTAYISLKSHKDILHRFERTSYQNSDLRSLNILATKTHRPR